MTILHARPQLNDTVVATDDSGQHWRRPEIDGLRALAVLAVLLFHFEVPGFAGGFIGVDIFFVISGYLITSHIYRDLASGTFSVVKFYRRRILRILPALFVTLLATIAVGLVVLSPADLKRLGVAALTVIGFSSNILFWREAGYFDQSATTKPLLHTWSLSVEEQFYILLPIVLMITFALRPKLLKWVVLLLGLSSLTATLALADRASAIFYLTPFRIFEFTIGAAVIWLPPLARSIRNILAGSGVAITVASLFLLDASQNWPTLLTLAPCVGVALVIYGGTSVVSLISSPAWIQAIGRASYSLYLVHWPVYVYALYILGRDLSWMEVTLVLAASLGMAFAMRRLVELPFLDGTGTVRHILAAGALVGLAAAALIATNGLPQRITLIRGVELPPPPVYGGVGCDGTVCETNAGAAKTVYLLGDSYMRAYRAGLAEHFPDINFIVYENGGCEFYSDRFIGDAAANQDACIAARQQGFEATSGTTATVILSQHWAANMTENQIDVTGEAEPVYHSDPAEYGRWVAGEISKLSKNFGGKVIVIGGPPKFGDMHDAARASQSPYDCLARPLSFADCGTSYRFDSVRMEHAQINSSLSTHLPPEITFVDPYMALCSDTECLNFTDGGLPIYSDYGHLSTDGSAYTVEKLVSLNLLEF